MGDRIQFAIDEQIARIVINRPEKLNALDPDMLADISGHLQALDVSTDARVLILAAEGARAFCVGADIGVWSGLEPLAMWRDWVRTGRMNVEKV